MKRSADEDDRAGGTPEQQDESLRGGVALTDPLITMLEPDFTEVLREFVDAAFPGGVEAQEQRLGWPMTGGIGEGPGGLADRLHGLAALLRLAASAVTSTADGIRLHYHIGGAGGSAGDGGGQAE